MRILLVIPPMTQWNTPYPSTAFLTGFLRSKGIDAVQADASIELVHKLLSNKGMDQIRTELQSKPALSESGKFFMERFKEIRMAIEPVMRFLSGRDPSLASRIATRNFLPEGPKFLESIAQLESTDYLDFAFGTVGVHDRAKHFATLFVDDICAVILREIDPHFEPARYGEKLSASQPSFDPLARALSKEPTLVDLETETIARELLVKHAPDLVCFSAPFPGNVYAAFRMAKAMKEARPGLKTAIGGGWVNTELRRLNEPRVFEAFDFVTLDDGELPLLRLLRGEAPVRTFMLENGKVVFKNDEGGHDIPAKDVGTPTYDGLPLEKYVSLLEMPNPMHRMWSDARWNKLMLAHGCYWKKCSFCDVSLDYIGRYDPVAIDVTIERMIKIAAETGQTGFHFVDEAAPPALLKALSERILERGLAFTWWGNLRFDKTFTPELTKLMAKAGCVAVTGGIEVASDRLLKLMNKGVTIEQVAQVTRAFNEAGILVHAYLMYGFPTETEQETVESLEIVRQLFAAGCIDSAYWHRFSATVHSPVGLAPAEYGIKITSKMPAPGSALFSMNDLTFEDPTPADHEMLGRGLKKALYNFMHGIGLDEDVRGWFDRAVARLSVPKKRIQNALKERGTHERNPVSDSADRPRITH